MSIDIGFLLAGSLLSLGIFLVLILNVIWDVRRILTDIFDRVKKIK